MQFYWLVLGILCVWRITHFFYAEDGPWEVVVRLRRRAGPGFWAQLMDCFYCLSVWVAAPFAWLIGPHWMERLLLWPALSAGAILLERLTARTPPPAPYLEDERTDHGLLQRKENAVSHQNSESSDS